MRRRFVVLGNGIAGFSAAEAIRRNQADAEITMISEEKISTYLRPLLSKTYFKTFQKERIYVADNTWYEENHINQILGRPIEKIVPKDKSVYLSNGQLVSYDTCIYALGSRGFIPSFKGGDKKGVKTVRNVEDFDIIRKGLAVASNVVIIGGGVIGLEMAWEISQMACKLAILEAAPRLMGRLLDEESANILTDIIRDRGIQVFSGVQIEEITGESEATGVKLKDGTVYPADLVILSCGVRANVELAREAGIACDKGVLVNDYLQTSEADIYAAGDCIQLEKSNPSLWGYSKTSGETAGFNASTTEKYKKFIPSMEFVVLSSMGTNLFSGGSVDERDGIKTLVKKGDKDFVKYRFEVNKHETSNVCYEKNFYKDNKLCGAVIIGDLSKMEQLKREMNGEIT